MPRLAPRTRYPRLVLALVALASCAAPAAAQETYEPLGGPRVPRTAFPHTSAKRDALIEDVYRPELSLYVTSGHANLVRSRRPVARFSIANPQIVDIIQYGPREFELIGLTQGETTVNVWFEGFGARQPVLGYRVIVGNRFQPRSRFQARYGR